LTTKSVLIALVTIELLTVVAAVLAARRVAFWYWGLSIRVGENSSLVVHGIGLAYLVAVVLIIDLALSWIIVRVVSRLWR
jgi:hypothetical protein